MQERLKQMGIETVTLNNYLSGRVCTNHGWVDIIFSPEEAKSLVNMFVNELGGWYSSRDQMRRILLHFPSHIRQCGIMDRLWYDVEKNRVIYCAGQSYVEELAVIRNIIRK